MRMARRRGATARGIRGSTKQLAVAKSAIIASGTPQQPAWRCEHSSAESTLGQGKPLAPSSRSALLQDQLQASQCSGMAAPIGNGGSVPLTVNDGNASSASSSLAPKPHIDPNNHVVMLDNCECISKSLVGAKLTALVCRRQVSSCFSCPHSSFRSCIVQYGGMEREPVVLTMLLLRGQLHLEPGALSLSHTSSVLLKLTLA